SDLTEEEVYPAHITSRSLADLINGTGENRSPGDVGARVVEFLEAGYRSSETGAVVKIMPRG
ncbi:MAG: hypothetical protein OXK79_04175, partial [Chloroflexota bacterium]|nr:hypothetical protein [Chloroflexota bacterium]